MKDIIDIIKKKSDIENFNCIKIGLASPEQILARSYGEIKKAETINYRTFKPERDGLFCAKIFGPIKDYECLCGKYKKLKHRGIICEKCGVEVTSSNVRRSRMANITLATPIAHIWFLKSLPSKIGLLLDINLKDVEKILYFEQYVIIDPGTSLLKKGNLLTEDESTNISKQYGDEVIIQIGAEAIQTLLKNLNIHNEIKDTKEKIKLTNSDIKIKKLSKRLKILESFANSDNKPEWMILNVLPVLPPDLRPLVPLDGGRFASSDLNDLYRRVINRNNRLKKLIDLSAPNIIIKNEKRMLQEAIDALIDNGRRGKTVNGSNKRPLKSLADMIKGKHGRFRQNLLGKRVDYSGRSVIVVGPKLKLHQCGLPKKMAIELFKPFIFGELKKRNITTTIKSSKKLVEEEGSNIWDILNEIVYEHPVLLNRAPTLHRLGIQAFEPILIDGKAIQLHPLVCTAFNADFDGDQMAIHIPLTIEAQLESKILMMSTNNILSPANGEPTIVPSQDIVLGIYYLSKEKKCDDKNFKFFKNVNDIEKALENSTIKLHESILLQVKQSFIKTTCGRALLSKILPENLSFDLINKLMTKKEISNLISICYKKNGVKDTVILTDKLMNIGFDYATKSGISIGIEDIRIPKEKYDIIKKTDEHILNIDHAYANGLINKEDRYNQIIDTWSKANDSITKVLMKNLSIKEITNSDGKILTEDSFNPIYMMAESGARGSITQIRQLAGMRGLMAKPDGSIIETPITANFREGLNILQYFISTHGARKGLADTALKTANSGYLTRRLVDVAQDIVITKNDCETHDSITITEVVDDGNVVEKLTDKIKGRIIQENILDKSGNIIINIGTLLNDEHIELIDQLNIKKIIVRSVITCKLKHGVCSKCYGTDLTTNKLISIGEAVGVIAAQSIGEPGTQLTMRTFHIGGAASRTTLINNIQNKNAGIIEYKNIKTITQEKTNNIISISRSGKIIITDKEKKELEQYKIPYGATIHKLNHSLIQKNELIATWDPHNIPIISETNGIIKYSNLIEGITLKKELDEATGISNLIVFDSNKSEQNINNVKPSIEIINTNILTELNEKNITNYFLSPGTIISVENNQKIKIGDIIAKIPKETSKVKDITGGLPRVADIFEARKPKNPAILADVSGTVLFGKETRDKNRILIQDENENFHEILIPKWKNVNVFENESVLRGDILVEGEQNLHDILRLLGINELTDQIKKEVQEVYRLQGVKIDDRHIEIIVKQMLKKVIIVDPGDSDMIKDDQENMSTIEKINKTLKSENKKEVIFKPILLGITKAALTTESFISAASFQETTKILTDAAISGKKDKLLGLKENVIVGKLIPAGTGFYQKLNQP